MIRTYSTTIRRKEMDAVLTCMVDEKIGPGELNARFIGQVKQFFECDGAVALRSPKIALKLALQALGIENKTSENSTKIMISALAPAWQYQALDDLGYEILVLDVEEETGLVNAEIVQRGINHGGRVLLLYEGLGILPNMADILALNIPIIEDISKSAGSLVPQMDENGNALKPEKAGSFGVFSILGLEEKDVITSGGGAVLMATKRRDWIFLKKFVDDLPSVDLLPDINAALGFVQLKEFLKNEKTRKEIFSIYQRSAQTSKHKMLARLNNSGELTEENAGFESTASCFPLVFNGSVKDVQQYAAKKDVEVRLAFEDSVIALKSEELEESCVRAKSLFLRCVLFPLYPRLSGQAVEKVAKVVGSI